MTHAFILAFATILPQQMDAKEAAKTAGEWWGEYRRGSKEFGAAWYNEGTKKYYVGVCDGFSKEVGYKRIVVKENGGYYNFSTDAKYKTPDGKQYYSNAEWFGYGATYEEAFYEAMKKGYAPLMRTETGHIVDLWMRDKFIKEKGLKPFKYKEEP